MIGRPFTAFIDQSSRVPVSQEKSTVGNAVALGWDRYHLPACVFLLLNRRTVPVTISVASNHGVNTSLKRGPLLGN